jgi:AcrR family transcriptional regulator
MREKDRRQQILDCALKVFAEKGFHGASVSDVIARAGVARGTFYLYFAGKREVFDAVLDGILARLRGQIRPVLLPAYRDDAAVLEQLRGNVERVVGLLMGNRGLVRLLVNEAAGLDSPVRVRLDAFHRALGAWMAESLEEGQRFGIVRPGDAQVMAHGLLGMLQGILRAWAFGMLTAPRGTVVEEVLSLVCSGVLTLEGTGRQGLPGA